MKNAEFRRRYGEYAIVTGASAGMGAEFARQLAARGMNLVLVARRRGLLEAAARELTAAYGVDVRPIALDLSNDDAVDALARATDALEIGLVVLNAAVLTVGPFLGNALPDETHVVRLNVLAPMTLAHRFGGLMKRRSRGGILFVSSVAGHGAAPFQANYAATKAYVLALGLALHVELRAAGVDVTVLSPGLTNTEGVAQAAGIDFTKLPMAMMSAERAVRVGLDALGRKMLVIPGGLNNVMDFLGKYLAPRSVMTKVFARIMTKAISPGLLLGDRTQEAPGHSHLE